MPSSLNDYAILWDFIKVGAGAVVGWLLQWLQWRKALLELQKAKLELAETQRDEKQRTLCAAIVAVVRDARAQLDHPKNIVFSVERIAISCNASVADTEGALAVLRSQGRAERDASGSWAIYAS